MIVRRSSESSVAYVFGISISVAVAVGREWQNRPRWRPDGDVRDDVELLARVEERLLEREVVARRDDQLVRRAALAQQRRQRREEAVDRRRLHAALEQRVQLVLERARALASPRRTARPASARAGRRRDTRSARASRAASSPTSVPSTGTSRPASIAFDDLGEVVLGAAAARRRRRRARLLPQDRAVQLLERRARLDPELVDERAPRVLVHLERLGLPARPVEREHQLAAEPLAQRMLRDERLELADELGVAPELELGVDPLLERRQPQLLEPRDLRLRERLEREVGERLARARARAPRAELRARARPRAAARASRRVASKRSRSICSGSTREHVAGRPRHERRRRRAACAAATTKFWSDVAAVRGGCSPQSASIEPVGRDDPAGVEEEEREHAALLLAAERDDAVLPRPRAARAGGTRSSARCNSDPGSPLASGWGP